jgi:ketosteroid isomerase-like protein
LNRRDQYDLELVLSPLFVDVAANGDITTRSQQIAQLITSDDPTFHLQQRVITVRMLGDIAVANGTYALHHKAGSAQVDQKGVFTQVFERVHGGWQCVNSQRTEVRESTNVDETIAFVLCPDRHARTRVGVGDRPYSSICEASGMIMASSHCAVGGWVV